MTTRMRCSEVFAPGSYGIASATLHLDVDVPAHSHEFYELAVVAGGRAAHLTRRGRQQLVRGDVVAVRPGDWHEYRAVRGLQIVNVYVAAGLVTGELDWMLRYRVLAETLLGPGDAAIRLRAPATTRVLGWLAALSGGPPHTGSVGELQARSLLACVLAEFVVAGDTARPATPRPTAPRPTTPRPDPGLVGDAVLGALAAMTARPAQAWTVEDLARRAAVSPSYLHHQFAAQLDTSPLRWLTRHRAELMALRLVGGTDAVARVGADVGWGDPNYAARRFRQEFGMSPTQYRRRFALGGGEASETSR